ncbi:MAG: Gfo/Idh/MocA family oxidoreductase [Planctomycetes bacterium]|nr:Gfo/Idh/MocA family oxidoreductase [Planctomycetota bacterium]
MKKLRTAIIGAGKMGAIHAKVYHQLKISEFVGIVDVDYGKARKLARKYKCEAFSDCSDLLGKVDAVTIATPTTNHLEVAKVFLENKVPVLIEKPLAANVAQAKEIVALAKKNKTVVAVGHSERCNPVVQAVKRLNIKPKFIECNRISPYSFRSTDIGVILDVMIHDIDIILSMANSKIKKVDAIGVNVLGDNEDICNARIFFENGCIANITASRVALKTERKVRVFSRQAYLSVDYYKKTGTVIQAGPNVNITEQVRKLKNSSKFDLLKANWKDMLHIEKLNVDDKEPLRLEQESFLKAVMDESSSPEVSAADGLAAMECAEMILNCLDKHQW